ncbi:MAG: glycosyltransferase [Chloroflexi bacterium]|nr:glycosyltransferase [Chloroflexota bacterium]
MKVALVHDWLNQYGGAERVLEVLHDLFPQAPVYTSIYDPAALPATYRQWDIRTSFMQSLPLVKRRHQPFMPLYPLAFEQFDLTAYDLVISNSSAFCHGVLTPAQTVHVCYCLTPTRFVWNFHDYVREERLGGLARLALPPVLAQLRLWDRLAADRVDHFAAISRAVAGRIAKFYRRDSDVIHPPVDCSSFQPAGEPDDYFLVVSRLIPYKRVELAVRACGDLGLPLLVAGDGRYRAALERIAKPNVRFLGWVDETRLRDLYAHCRALIFPGEEDFGLTPLEAQASGRPVIAYAGGGALDTVVPGVTGEFFAERSWEALAELLLRFRAEDYDPAAARHNALRFEVTTFKECFRHFVEQRLAGVGPAVAPAGTTE